MKFAIDDVYTFYAQTSGINGAEDADSVPTYRIYEQETATPILTGSMALLDAANTDGFYSEQITLSAANGFEDGKRYCNRKEVVVGGVTHASIETFTVSQREKIIYQRMAGKVVFNPSALTLTIYDTDDSTAMVTLDVTKSQNAVTQQVPQ